MFGSGPDRPAAVNFSSRVRPKGETIGVAAVAWLLVETNEGRRFALTLSVIADPGFRDTDVRQTQLREEDIIKFPGLPQSRTPESQCDRSSGYSCEKDDVGNKHPSPRPQPSNRTFMRCACSAGRPIEDTTRLTSAVFSGVLQGWTICVVIFDFLGTKTASPE